IPPREWVAHPVPVGGEDLLDVSAARVGEIIDVESHGLFWRSAQIGVAPEIAEHEVLSPGPAQVDSLDAVPPSVRPGQPSLFGAIDELARLLVKDAHRHPFTDDNEVELTVVIVIDPRC